MKTRRHHNNKGHRQIKTGGTTRSLKHICRKLGLKMENPVHRITAVAESATQDMHRKNSDAALQAAIELMLTDRPSAQVVANLRSWADYLEDRS